MATEPFHHVKVQEQGREKSIFFWCFCVLYFFLGFSFFSLFTAIYMYLHSEAKGSGLVAEDPLLVGHHSVTLVAGDGADVVSVPG